MSLPFAATLPDATMRTTTGKRTKLWTVYMIRSRCEAHDWSALPHLLLQSDKDEKAQSYFKFQQPNETY